METNGRVHTHLLSRRPSEANCLRRLLRESEQTLGSPSLVSTILVLKCVKGPSELFSAKHLQGIFNRARNEASERERGRDGRERERGRVTLSPYEDSPLYV